MANPALDKQVLDDDSLTIEDVKQFISDANKKREDFLNIADRSWNEIEKRNQNGRLFGGNDLYKRGSRTRFPLWWSCLKIRQPLVFARLPIPVLKDTQGDDPFGRTACVVGERLTRGILKTFDAFSELAAGVDDFLVTNFGFSRVFYRKEDCVEDEKIRLQVVEQQPPPQEPMMDEMGQPMPPPPQEPLPPIFLTPDGQQVPEEQILDDEFGPYILSGQQITVDNEEVYIEAGLYNSLLVDPDIHKWNAVTKVAFKYEYTYRQFIAKFGKETLEKLPIADIQEHKSGKAIVVYEYWDKFLKECRWLAENSSDFFQPLDMQSPDVESLVELDEDEEAKLSSGYDHSDIYGLSGFFPCTDPLLINSSTKEFWPTPEYFQVSDMIDNIHSVVGRMIHLTKAIRVRFLFDSSIPKLSSLIGENWAQGEGTGIGIPNLEQSLMNNKGSLSALVAYFPVDELIKGLQNMYIAFQQQMDMFYQITGISDLIRGATNNEVAKTYGERQMEGKFALNRIEPYQRKVQEWIKDQYQLLMEMGLKMFSDKTLDEYITPQTLDPEDKQRYIAALELLKSNKRRRFRVDFETDSTIAINEEYKRKQATELANTITKAMESVANVAQTQPELAGTELQVLKHLIGEFSDGKLFVDEIQDSIQQVIDKVKQPKPPEFNKDEATAQLEQARFQFEQQKQIKQDQFKEMEIQASQQIEIAKIQQNERLSGIEAQLSQYKISVDSQTKQMQIQADMQESAAELQKEYQKISADIAQAQQELALKRDELLVELRKVADKKEVDQFALMIDERVANFEAQLESARLELESTTSKLDLQERFITEQRLQAEHQLQLGHSKIESLEKVIDVALKKKELDAPIEVIKPEVKEKPKKSKKRKSKVVRDKNGEIAEIIHEED